MIVAFGPEQDLIVCCSLNAFCILCSSQSPFISVGVGSKDNGEEQAEETRRQRENERDSDSSKETLEE